MPDFSVLDKFNPDKGFTQVKFGANAKVLEVELNEMQRINQHALAELTRTQVHSGVVDYNGTIYSDLNADSSGARKGSLSATDKTDLPTYANVIRLYALEALMNGYKLKVNGHNDLNNGNIDQYNSNDIKLPEPPTFGSREDLVFLEAWFEEVDYTETIDKYGGESSGTLTNDLQDSRLGVETSRRIQMKWRIRTVEDVDFAKFPEGFHINLYSNSYASYNHKATAQGGNTAPTETSDGNRYIVHFSPEIARPATTMLDKFIGDKGLYVAGKGNQTSKDILKTVDGYVYAIPLFRVKRRNSGGYHADNLSGARGYLDYTLTYDFPARLIEGQTGQITITGNIVNVGDVLTFPSDTKYRLKIISNDGNDLYTVKVLGDGSANSGLGKATNQVWELESDRPDNLYSNIIDKNDIIDLRHKVSLTGFNYQQVLEENFDKLLRGELQTKDKTTAVKERYGLQKAPLGLEQELQAVRIKGDDGVYRDLVNELGTDGDCERTDAFLKYRLTPTLDSTNKTVGNNGVKATIDPTYTVGTLTLKFPMYANRYYVFMADVKNGNASKIHIQVTGTDGKLGGEVTDSSKFTTTYLKIATTVDTLDKGLEFAVWGLESQYGYIDAMRVYDVDKATYDRIDSGLAGDEGFTGEELAKKFPYVDSYPNFVDNQVPEKYFSESAIGGAGTYTRTALNKEEAELYLGGHTHYIDFASFDIGGESVSFSLEYKKINGTGSGNLEVRWQDSAGTPISTTTYILGSETEYKSFSRTPIPPSNAAKVEIRVYAVNGDLTCHVKNPLFSLYTERRLYIPYGRHYLTSDLYGNSHLHENTIYDATKNFGSQRSVFSDAQTSEVRTDIVDNLKTPQSHITVTQATEGTWAVGDKFKIKSYDGVLTGVIDSDTALARVTKAENNSNFLYVDDVSKLAVNDVVLIALEDMTSPWTAVTLTEVDSVNNKITWSGALGTLSNAKYVIETTASSSSPTIAHTSTKTITGTWTNLGTKEITYTINGITDGVTTGLTDTTDFEVKYSHNLPAGQGIDYVPSEVLEASVNGDRLVKGTTVSVKDNYEGKLNANTDLVSHVAKYDRQSTLESPTGTWVGEIASSSYKLISELTYVGDSKVDTSVNGEIAQWIFSFDLIRLVEDKYGEIPRLTTADKVQWLKDNVAKFTFYWWGYGIAPSGNICDLALWKASTGSWDDNNYTGHTNSTVTKVNAPVGHSVNYPVANYVDANGFAHLNAHTDASDGVTASTIYTDYVELEIELNVAETGYTVFQPENPFPKLSENLLFQKYAFPIDHSVTSGLLRTIPEVGVGRYTRNSDGTTAETWASFYVTSDTLLPTTQYTFTFEARGSGALWAHFWNGGSDVYGESIQLNDEWQTVTVTTKTTASWSTTPHGQARTNLNDGSTFDIRKIRLNKSYRDVGWTEGLKKRTLQNFLGKVAGSTVENPHKSFSKGSATFDSPSTFVSEYATSSYDAISKQDAVLRSQPNLTNTVYSQSIYEFDLSHLGLSLKQLKDTIRKFRVEWTGYGRGSNAGVATYGATTKWWNNNSSAWEGTNTNTSSSPTTVGMGTSVGSNFASPLITNDMKLYALVHSTYAADGTIASELWTDYVKLEVELADYVDYVKSNIVKVRPETKEVKLAFPAKASRYIGQGANDDVVSLWYKQIPYQYDKVPLGTAEVGRVVEYLNAVATKYGTGSQNGALSTSPYKHPTLDLVSIGTTKPSAFRVDELISDITTDFLSSMSDPDNVRHHFMYEDIPLNTPWLSSVGRYRLSKGMVLGYGAGTMIFTSAKTLNDSGVLYMLPILIEKDGELRMLIIVNTQVAFQSFNSDIDGRVLSEFKIQGRPLIKAVN
jgi:hypothetical protein